MKNQKQSPDKTKKSTAAAGTATLSSLTLLFSACCIGPLAGVVAFLGISGSASLAISNVLGPFEPHLLGIAILSMAVGFYYSYRPGKVECASDKVCATPGGKNIERILLWTSAIITVAFVFYRYIYPRMLFL